MILVVYDVKPKVASASCPGRDVGINRQWSLSEHPRTVPQVQGSYRKYRVEERRIARSRGVQAPIIIVYHRITTIPIDLYHLHAYLRTTSEVSSKIFQKQY